MTDLLFARWFGLVSVILSLGILFNLEDAREMAKRMLSSDAGYVMGGVLPVIFGSLSLLFSDSFKLSWSLAITIVGASMLFTGIFRVILVDQWRALVTNNIEKIPFLLSLFGLMIGVMLLYIGYFAHAFDFVPH